MECLDSCVFSDTYTLQIPFKEKNDYKKLKKKAILNFIGRMTLTRSACLDSLFSCLERLSGCSNILSRSSDYLFGCLYCQLGCPEVRLAVRTVILVFRPYRCLEFLSDCFNCVQVSRISIWLSRHSVRLSYSLFGGIHYLSTSLNFRLAVVVYRDSLVGTPFCYLGVSLLTHYFFLFRDTKNLIRTFFYRKFNFRSILFKTFSSKCLLFMKIAMKLKVFFLPVSN